jgi:hypothetical protein
MCDKSKISAFPVVMPLCGEKLLYAHILAVVGFSPYELCKSV